MKTRKLMAVLVMVALIVTALPVVALGAGDFNVEKTSVELTTPAAGTKAKAGVTNNVQIKITLRDADGNVVTDAGTLPVKLGDWDAGDVAFDANSGEGTAKVTVSAAGEYKNVKVKVGGKELKATFNVDVEGAEALMGASRIYASKDKVDAGDTITVSIYLRDQFGNPTTNLGTYGTTPTNYSLYVWAERVKDELSTIELISEPAEAAGVVHRNSLVEFLPQGTGTPRLSGNIITVKYKSNFAGEVKYWFGIDENGKAASGGVKDLPNKATSATVNIAESVSKYQLTLPDRATVESASRDADGITAHEVTFKVLDSTNLPVKGQKVNFESNSSWMHLNKESAESDYNGEVKVKATSERMGTYRLTATLDSNRNKEVEVDLRFGASGAYDIKVKKGDGVVVALDESYTFEFEIFDIFGRLIQGDGNAANETANIKNMIDRVEVVTAPDKAKFKDTIKDNSKENGKINTDKGKIEWKKNANLKVIAEKNSLDKEGDYVLQVRLSNGKYATAKFSVKKQGKVVGMTLKYDPAYTSGKATGDDVGLLLTEKHTVKLVDADGVEAEIANTNKDLEFTVNNTRIAKIDENGVVTQRTKDSEGIVVVTVVNKKHNVAATAEVRIGDVGAEGVVFDVPEELLIDTEYSIGMKVVDEAGNKTMKKPLYNVVLLDKPAGAKVNVDERGDKFIIESDTKGEVKLVVTARDDEGDKKAVSSTLTLDFLAEPLDVFAGKVILTLGDNFGFVDGQAQELDAPAFIEDGRTFVPVRFLAEAFGADVDYDPKDGAVETVTLTTDEMEIVIGIGDEFLTVTIDDEAEVVTFDGAARIVAGRTFLPFRAIAEAFGAEVDYGPKTGAVEWVSFE